MRRLASGPVLARLARDLEHLRRVTLVAEVHGCGLEHFILPVAATLLLLVRLRLVGRERRRFGHEILQPGEDLGRLVEPREELGVLDVGQGEEPPPDARQLWR
jgi:hypothetical protein